MSQIVPVVLERTGLGVERHVVRAGSVHASVRVVNDANDESRQVAEQSRQKWTKTSFIRELCLGEFRIDLLDSLAMTEPSRPEFWDFYRRFETFLREHVDPVEIDASGEYPKHVVQGLADLGAFGMKIPKEYGGLGLSHPEYVRIMELLGSHDANVTALLSAHQAIGVPQPVLLFGTDKQKQDWLPRCAKGAISAFALTEPAVGSDPSQLATTATRDGDHFVLNGRKLWCTNGTLAELIVVMARDPETDRINAFMVEMDTPGVVVEHRCRFMGLRALANASLRFDDVRIPKENLIGEEGEGLKIALVTLNTGRLSLPAATAGMAKQCVEIVRKWSSAREQWGQAIGKHEAIARKNATIATTAFAMESTAFAVGELADREDLDLRLEAAAAKEWNTVRGWRILDETLQVRGGRGFETERSLDQRDEAPIGIERMMRDARINMVFEGTSEVMHLFIAREGVDKHLEIAGTLVDPDATPKEKMNALPSILKFYAKWYAKKWFSWGYWPNFSRYGRLSKHLRYVERTSRRLARSLFHGMVVHGAKLENKQAFLFRAMDVAMELFVMSATIRRARVLQQQRSDQAAGAVELADLFARQRRREVDRYLKAMWRNDDAKSYSVARRLLEGRYGWLEKGIIGLPYDAADLEPPRVEELQQPEPESSPSREAINA